MNLSRRSLLSGLIAAPAVILTPGLLMPVRPWIDYVTPEMFGAMLPPKRGSITQELIEGRPLWARFVDKTTGRVLLKQRVTFSYGKEDHVAHANDVAYTTATEKTVVPEIVSDNDEVLLRYDWHPTMGPDQTLTIRRPLSFG